MLLRIGAQSFELHRAVAVLMRDHKWLLNVAQSQAGEATQEVYFHCAILKAGILKDIFQVFALFFHTPPEQIRRPDDKTAANAQNPGQVCKKAPGKKSNESNTNYL